MMDKEQIRLTCSYWCKFLLTYHGRYSAENLKAIENSANEILKLYNTPLSYDLMNVAMSELERSVQS